MPGFGSVGVNLMNIFLTMSKQQIIKKKKQALNYFTSQILASPIKAKIDRMILFGSLAYGEPHHESDIDLLVVSRGQKNKLEDELANTAFDTLLQYGELVEPMVYRLEDFKKPKSSFLTEAIQCGQQIYAA